MKRRATSGSARKGAGGKHRPASDGESAARARLAHSEAQLRAVVENAVDGIIVIDSGGHIESANPSAERLFGYSVRDLIGRNVNMLMPEPFRSQHDGYLANYLTTGVRKIIGIGREVVGQRSDGSTFPMDLAVSEIRLGRERKFTGLVRDITQLKKQFETLERARAAEARFRVLVEAVQDYAIIMLDSAGHVTSWNAGAERIKGYRAEEIIGQPLAVFYPPEDRLAHLPELALEEAARLGRAEREGWRVRKDGSRIWATAVLTALRDSQGKLTGFAKVTRDLTERKRAESELRDRETRLRTLITTTADGIIVFNAQGRIESFNPAAERLFGFTTEEAFNREVRLLLAGPRASAGGSPREIIAALQGEGVGRRKDGTTFPMEVSLSEMMLAEQRLVTAVVRDITARKQADDELRRLNGSLAAQVEETQKAMDALREAQVQLVQTEKLASLGSTVAGVAHEINTPLGVSVTAASTLEAMLGEVRAAKGRNALTDAALADFFETAGEAVQMTVRNLRRAAELVNNFKEIAVDQTSDARRVFKVREYIDEVLSSLKPKFRNTRHELTLACPDDLQADTYPGALAQILTNFITNSLLHGFADGRAGHITIAVERLDPKMVLFTYGDDGTGIPASNLSRVFDPFFTTRRGSGGSGLGLHIVHNLVTQRLGGTIKVTSEPGLGARFEIRMPLKAPVRPNEA